MVNDMLWVVVACHWISLSLFIFFHSHSLSLSLSLPFPTATACQLYKATLSTYNSPSQPLFDGSLGVFMPNSFALSYQYMFTQVFIVFL